MERHAHILSKGIAVLSATLILLGLYLTSLYSYLLFHSLVEIFSIVVACSIFVLAWNARRFLDNNSLLFLGIAYLFVGALDLVHTLAYKGMGVFQGYDANLPTQLWIATRYVQSLSLLAAPLFLRRNLRPHLVSMVYTAFTILLLGAIFYGGIFPACYVEGIGLTSFKKVSEYIISLILLAAIAMLLRNRREFDRSVLRLLVLSIIVTIGSELAFTFYISVYDFSNLTGHFFKLISFYLVYKALVETGLVKPYNLLFRNLKQSEEALHQRTVELQARNEELDAFAHTVAHDLKGSLSVIVGFVELLQEDYATIPAETLDKYLHDIKRRGHKMGDIIEELLLLAQVPKMEIQMELLDMAHIVNEALLRMGHEIEGKQARIVLPDTWPEALGYGPWIEEVWLNYLSNAIRYGGQPPHVELGATELPDDQVRFWIRDNGAGLAPQAQARLFTPFTRLDQDHATGYGLGLSIVRRIVEKLDGQVGVESQVGQGSTFTFTLRAAQSGQEYDTKGA